MTTPTPFYDSFVSGSKAFHAGFKNYECPHPMNSPMGQAWRAGWEIACADGVVQARAQWSDIPSYAVLDLKPEVRS